MANTKIIDFLENQGKIDKVKADQLRVQLAQDSLTEEQLLFNEKITDDVTIAQAKSSIFNIPFVDLTKTKIEDAVLTTVSGDILKRFKALPFAQEGNLIKVAMIDPFDIQAIQSMERMFPEGTRLSVYITSSEELLQLLERKVGESITTEVSAALEDVDETFTNLDTAEVSSLEDANIQNAPVARIVDSMFQYAVKAAASDIHVEPMETKLRVRIRVHGILTEKLALPKYLSSAVIARIKIMADLKIDEKRVPQDGRINLKSGEHKIDVRVSTLPTVYGEKIVMRLLEAETGAPPLETSGMRGMSYRIFLDAIKATNGIILITGPTGSGKSTTLAGTLAKLNDPRVNIITLENPVEIRVPGVNQVQINPDVGLTFASGLRSILRQDPNIVMVGEIRDQETAQLAVEASLTGHLVLSTLHTNSSSAAVSRLLDMGVESYLLASTLRLVVAQRLPRRICDRCRQAYAATQDELEFLKKELGTIKNFEIIKYCNDACKNSTVLPESVGKSKVPTPAEIMKCPEKDASGNDVVYLYKGAGCDVCGGTGYVGRIGIFEVLPITEEIGKMMGDNPLASEIEKIAIANGMVLMRQDGYLKALEGVTTIEEVLRVSKE